MLLIIDDCTDLSAPWHGYTDDKQWTAQITNRTRVVVVINNVALRW